MIFRRNRGVEDKIVYPARNEKPRQFINIIKMNISDKNYDIRVKNITIIITGTRSKCR